MKSVYNILKEPIKQYFRKDPTLTFAAAAFSQTVKDNGISNRKSYKLPQFIHAGIGYRQFSRQEDRVIKFADPRNDMAFKKIFSEDNIDGIKDFNNLILLLLSTQNFFVLLRLLPKYVTAKKIIF